MMSTRVVWLVVAVVVVAVATATDALPVCTEEDIHATFSPCTDGTRLAFYYFQDCDDAQSVAPLPVSGETVSCECTRYEYENVFGACSETTHRRSNTPVLRADADCEGPASLPATEVLCPCTPEDAVRAYSECLNGLRSALYFWDESECDPATADLPAAVHDLPCEIACAPGEYLPFGELSCEQCDEGTYSVGSGVVVNDFVSPALPIVTECVRTTDQIGVDDVCAEWGPSLDGGELETGAFNGTDSVLSSATMGVVVILEDGMVAFEYRVEAEFADRFKFKVDGITHVSAYSADAWTLVSVPLSVGTHTLRWEYVKDVSVSVGDDFAAIRRLSVHGVTHSVQECTPCAPGYVSDAKGSPGCRPCGINEHAANPGSAVCDACAASEYAGIGFPECLARPACTADDYQMLVDAGCENGESVASYVALEPKICAGGVPAPAPHPVACPACPPGTERDTAGACSPCATGWASGGHLASTCQQCEPGEYVTPLVALTTWDSWTSQGMQVITTHGWRLRHSYIDSGGISAVTGDSGGSLHLNFEISDAVSVGTVWIEYSLHCAGTCDFDVHIDGALMWSTKQEVSHKMLKVGDVAPGFHALSVYFERDSGASVDTQIAKIYQVRIEGGVHPVAGGLAGGAICTACPAGTESVSAGASACDACPPGTWSPGGASGCDDCPANTFSSEWGSATCVACGAHAPATPAGATECTQLPCGFTTPGGVTYDLSPLVPVDHVMDGPVSDQARDYQLYYVSLCQLDHQNHSCYNQHEAPLRSFACQINGHGYAHSLGDVLDYAVLTGDEVAWETVDSENGDGLAVKISNGWAGGCSHPRDLTVTLLCDPAAGHGMLTPPEEGQGTIEYPHRSCHYNLEWRSAFACPVCTHDDYASFEGQCHSGYATRHYYWKTPKRCTGGESLPEPERVTCGSAVSMSCPAGTFIDGDACTKCPKGTASAGGALVAHEWGWHTFETDFEEYLVSFDGWRVDGDVLQSEAETNGGSATLDLTVELVEDGTVSFSYSLLCHGSPDLHPLPGDGEGLLFAVDSIPVLSATYADEFVTHEAALSKGTHELGWAALSPPDHRPCDVFLKSIVITGVFEGAADCTVCGVQSRAEYSNKQSGATACQRCPVNTEATPERPATYCVPCPAGQFRLNHMDACAELPACREADYLWTYGACENGVTTLTASLPSPRLCNPDAPGAWVAAETPQTVACPACADNAIRVAGDGPCVTCPTGQVPEPAGTGCVKCATGQAAPKAIVATTMTPSVVDQLAAEADMETVCSGDCGSPGWRMQRGFMDSGVRHYAQADSILRFRFTIEEVAAGTPGHASFNAGLVDVPAGLAPGVVFLEVRLDGDEVTDIEPSDHAGQEYTIGEIAPGAHVLEFIYHQGELVNFETPPYARLNALHIHQTVSGGAHACHACDAGSYGNHEGLDACVLAPPGSFVPPDAQPHTSAEACPAGSYASGQGSTECQACGFGTTPNMGRGATDCVNSCTVSKTRTIPGDSVVERHETITYEFAAAGEETAVVFLPSDDNTVEVTLALNLCKRQACGQDSAYACLSVDDTLDDVSPPITTDVGSQIAFQVTEKTGFGVTLTGEDCAADPSRKETTLLAMSCNLEVGTGAPVAASGGDACERHLTWESALACPVCTADDLQKVVSACVGGTRTVQWVVKTPCVAVSPLEVTEESCNEVSVSFVLAGVIIVLCCGCTACVLCFLRRNRTLSHRYGQLLEGGDVPEPDMPSSLEEESREGDGAPPMPVRQRSLSLSCDESVSV